MWPSFLSFLENICHREGSLVNTSLYIRIPLCDYFDCGGDYIYTPHTHQIPGWWQWEILKLSSKAYNKSIIIYGILLLFGIHKLYALNQSIITNPILRFLIRFSLSCFSPSLDTIQKNTHKFMLIKPPPLLPNRTHSFSPTISFARKTLNRVATLRTNSI